MQLFLELHAFDDKTPLSISLNKVLALSPREERGTVILLEENDHLIVAEDYRTIKAALKGTEEVCFLKFSLPDN